MTFGKACAEIRSLINLNICQELRVKVAQKRSSGRNEKASLDVSRRGIAAKDECNFHRESRCRGRNAYIVNGMRVRR